MSKKKFIIFFLFIGLGYFFIFSFAVADFLGQNIRFNVKNDYDAFDRKSVNATLRIISKNAYFYVEDNYWNNLNDFERQQFLINLNNLANDFDSTIYPIQTNFWGQEAKPGVDGDNRITVLFQQLKKGNGGYFSSINSYPKNLAPESNEREMIVINAEAVKWSSIKSLLTHEFEHLISFNQKENTYNIEEEVWLNELRAEYSITLSGYNNVFSGSSLENRALGFFKNPSDSLVEWPNTAQDYSMVALLGEYIADKYGKEILADSLRSNLVGISSVDAILARKGYSDRFLNIFANWLVASYINDDSLGSKFGYSRSELKKFKAEPQRTTILYPSESNSFIYSLKPWQPYAHKFIISGFTNEQVIKLAAESGFKYFYFDNLGRSGMIEKDFYINNPSDLQYFYIFPINSIKISGFKNSENESNGRLNLFIENKTFSVEFGSTLKNGMIIKKKGESEIYVIEGKYKRYLRPEIIALYGHLDPSNAAEVNEEIFNSYITSNYVRYLKDDKVYAIWPDGTKHWLNITPQQWDESGRDWNAIFIINDLELNFYTSGPDITR
jgi:hypothetical protein